MSFDPRQFIYTPSQASAITLEFIKDIQQNSWKAVSLGIPGVDGENGFAPLMPGQTCAIIAQTSHYKSGLLHSIERKLARSIVAAREADHKRENDIVVHVSVEEGVEEMESLEYANLSGIPAGRIYTGKWDDEEAIRRAATEVINLPIFFIGDSQHRRDFVEPLHLTNIQRALDAMLDGSVFDFKPRFAGIFVDFLQKLPLDTEFVKFQGNAEQRRLQVMSDVSRLRMIAKHYDAPLFFGVQAKQELKYGNGTLQMPSVYDGEETSAIAQYTDRVLTEWMVGRTVPLGESYKFENKQWISKQNSLWLRIAKQRGGFIGQRAFLCQIDFIRNVITLDQDFLKPV